MSAPTTPTTLALVEAWLRQHALGQATTDVQDGIAFQAFIAAATVTQG